MSVLKIHLSYQCTAQCAHCRFGCDPDPKPAIDADLALMCVQELCRLNDLQLVVLMGGEPGLFPGLTHRLAKEISELGPHVRVETNAFWATSEQAAAALLAPLFGLGASVMYSLDAFHEPFVPLDNIECAIRAADALGGRYNVEVPYLDHASHHDPLDQRTDAILRELERRLGRTPCCRVYQGNVFFVGRAASALAPRVAIGRGVPDVVCDSVPWWGNGHLETLDLLILDADGYLSKGCGIAIGNVGQRSVESIVKSYNAQNHPIFATLLESGPLGLAREASELGYVLKSDYADRCHLCQEARQVLRARYPEYLVPAQHYQPSDPDGLAEKDRRQQL